MAHGIFHGLQHGAVHGVKHNALLFGSVPWTVDALSGRPMPANAAEWTAFRAAKGLAIPQPNFLNLCQEASGNLADSIGTTVLVGANAGRNYQQPVSGYTRLAVTQTDASNATWTGTTNVNDISTSDIFWMWIWLPPAAAPAAVRRVFQLGTTTNMLAQILTTGKLRVFGAANADSTNTVTGAAVMPLGINFRRSALNNTCYTDAEKLVPTFLTTGTGAQIIIGNGSGSTPAQGVLYSVGWNATITDAMVKALYQAFNFIVPWT